MPERLETDRKAVSWGKANNNRRAKGGARWCHAADVRTTRRDVPAAAQHDLCYVVVAVPSPRNVRVVAPVNEVWL